MCLAVPGKVVSIQDSDNVLQRSGKVSFGGIQKQVSLAYVPDIQIGEYVIVHAGFALNRVDEAEAQEVFEYLRQIDELKDLAGPEE